MMWGFVQDEENTGRADTPTPTKTDMCTSFSSFFPVSFADNVFPPQPQTVAVNSEADSGIGINPSLPSPTTPPPPPPPPPPVGVVAVAGQSGVLYSSDSGEVVKTLKLADTDSTSSSSDDEDDFHIRAIEKRSFLKSFKCLSILAILMIGSVAFIASLYIVYPRRTEVGSNVNYTFEDGHNETNNTQIETEEETPSSVVTDLNSPTLSPTSDVYSPSPTLSPTSDVYSPSPTLSPMSLDPTPQASGSPSMFPSQYPTSAVKSIALEAIEDTFIVKGETQYLGKGNGQAFGNKSTLRVKGGRDATIVTIIRFDTTPLIKLGASVVRTKLSLFARTDSVFGGQINLASDDCSWTEKDTSWANAPDCILKTGVDTSGQLDGWNGSDLLGWFSGDIVPDEWNETNLDWHPKQIPSQITLIISSDNEDGVTYASRNDDQNGRPRPPTINVEYYTK